MDDRDFIFREVVTIYKNSTNRIVPVSPNRLEDALKSSTGASASANSRCFLKRQVRRMVASLPF